MPDQSQPTMDPPVDEDAGPCPQPRLRVTGAGAPVATGSAPRWFTRDAPGRGGRTAGGGRLRRGRPGAHQRRGRQLLRLREQDLIDVLSGLAGTSQRARSEIDRLEQTKRDLQSDSRRRARARRRPNKQADNLNILAGLVPVTGPGIRVTITEKTGPVDIDSILDTIEELRSAGAEAMQVNGEVRRGRPERLRGRRRRVLGRRQLVTSPYVIDVIGDPHTLQGRSVFNQGPSLSCATTGPTSRSTSWRRSTSSRCSKPAPPAVRHHEPAVGSSADRAAGRPRQ